MERGHMNMNTLDRGELEIEEVFPNCVEVFYLPPKIKLEQSGMESDETIKHRVKLLLINGQDHFLTIFPTNTLGGHDDFLKPKHEKIRRITLDDVGFVSPVPESQEDVVEMLQGLSSGFTKDFDYGLGLAKEYRFIVNAVEELSNCEELVISKKEVTKIDQEHSIFYLSEADFEKARKSLNSISSIVQSAARSVKDVTIYNEFSGKVGIPERHFNIMNKNDGLNAFITYPVFQQRLVKYLALKCFRNSVLEDLHGGTIPDSKLGDYSDVIVHTPFGKIPWVYVK